jgi:DNA polymerase-3 subunit delta
MKPVYYLVGDEPYLMDLAMRELTDRLVPADMRDFNLNIFYAKECRGDEIAETAQTLPFLAEQRLIIVKRSEQLTSDALELLTGYLQNPSPSTCLVFAGDKLDQRRKFAQEIKKQGEVVEYKRLYDNQLPPFVREELASRNKKIAPEAVDLLVNLIGANLQELVSQIDKLVTYVGERPQVTLDDVRQIASDSRVASVFEISDAVGERNLPLALKRLTELYRDGGEPLQVLFILTRHFRQLWQAREILDSGRPQGEIAKALGISPYFVAKIASQAKQFRPAELKRLFERLFETDVALKSGGDDILVERLIIDICTPR